MTQTISVAQRAHTESRALRVVLGEDNFLAREGITAVLERLDGIELVAACGDLDSLRAEIDASEPDVVLTDIRMPPGHSDEGIRLAGELRATHPRIGVVVLSLHAEPLHATALFADGAHRRAYLLKDRLTEPGELARAIREVAAGGAVVDPRVVDELLAARHRQERSPIDALTPRELAILELVAQGYANAAIAERLGIGKRGVERHINAIFAKLELGRSDEVSRRVKAALLFLEASA
jgi:DNA-binding NarL/FixJ family response regulator